MLAALLITIAGLAVTSQLKPFMRQCDDFGNIVMHYQILLTLLGGLILSAGVAAADNSTGRIITFLVALNIRATLIQIIASFYPMLYVRYQLTKWKAYPRTTHFWLVFFGCASAGTRLTDKSKSSRVRVMPSTSVISGGSGSGEHVDHHPDDAAVVKVEAGGPVLGGEDTSATSGMGAGAADGAGPGAGAGAGAAAGQEDDEFTSIPALLAADSAADVAASTGSLGMALGPSSGRRSGPLLQPVNGAADPPTMEVVGE